MLDLNLPALKKNNTCSSVKIKELSSKEIAIIGMAVRMPKAKDTREFWNNLQNGVDCITEFPALRSKDIDACLISINGEGDTPEYDRGAYLDEIDTFDYEFFNISPKEAALMDPNQRLFLQTAWEALEDAGYGSDKIRGSKTGIYLGFHETLYNYRQLISKLDPSSISISLPGNLSAIIASRISYFLDLSGPSLIVDTACSSSLVAVHLACQGIRNMDCEMAIAGGVRINLIPVKREYRFGVESSTGISKAFDDSADGIGSGEGIAAVILKPLSRALQHRDNIYAVIKGSAINQDGSSVGITAPNVSAQKNVTVMAWKDAGIDPGTITFIETHGTGTKLGDPIEIEGIQQAFHDYTSKKQFCAIGSIKTNLGHLDNSAGIAGLVKAVLQLKHKKLAPLLHFNKPNSSIHFEESPVYINDRLTEWETEGQPRRCGISSFGLSGTNCHVILEEAPAIGTKTGINKESTHILTLSARSGTGIQTLLKNYLDYCMKPGSYNPGDICYMANTGRCSFNYRLAIVFKNNELTGKIKSLINIDLGEIDYNLSGIDNKWMYYGYHMVIPENKKQAENGEITGDVIKKLSRAARNAIEEYIRSGKNNTGLLHEICRLYVKGADINWEELYRGENRQKVSLPAYPFDGKRCWLEINKTEERIEFKDRFASSGDKLKLSAGNQKVHLVIKGKKDGNYSLSERFIAYAFCEVLGYREIDIHADFYKMGLDSILAVKIINSVNNILGTAIDITGLLGSRTIREFAEYIEKWCEEKDKGRDNKHPVIPLHHKKELFELSSAQRRLWVLYKVDNDNAAYSMPGVFVIEGDLDTDSMIKAYRYIVNRHEGLRTVFVEKDGTPWQKILADPVIAVAISDLRTEKNREKKANELIMKDAGRGFDFKKGPLVRLLLMRVEDEKYIMLVNMSHIISDGWSMGIFAKELITAYTSYSQDREPRLHPLPVQYKDYAHRQNELFKTGGLKKQETYWLNVFKEKISVLNIPYDYSRPAYQSFDGEKISCNMNDELIKEVKKLAEQTGTTFYMVLLASFTILLYRYSGQKDIVVGSPIAGRQNVDVQNLIGLFVNTIAMRNFPEDKKTFTEFLYEVRDHALMAYKNQDYPFEKLVENTDLSRDLSRNPLFDVMLIVQNMGVPCMEAGGLKFSPYKFKSSVSKFDITFEVIEDKGETILNIEYCTRLFTRETIYRMRRHFINIISHAVHNPDVTLVEIEMLSGKEKEQILTCFNNTKVEYPKEKTVYEFFEEQVEKNPHATAVVFEGQTLSYGELNRKANRLARILKKAGVKQDTIVGIMLERSCEMSIGIMAIGKAGGAYLPISPEYPDERIRHMLKDSGAFMLLTTEKFNQREVCTKEVLYIDDESLYSGDRHNKNNNWDSTDVEYWSNLEKKTRPYDLAYVIYTSGSTGTPKGVMIEHHAVVNRLCWMQKSYPIGPEDMILQKTPFTFDVSVWELFWWGMYGAGVCFLKPGGEKDPEAIVEAVEKYGITTMHFVPSMLTAFLGYIEENVDLDRLKSLRQVFASGEALHLKQVRAFNRLLNARHGTKLHNLYGPTEATVDVSYFPCSEVGELEAIPIGKPVDNTHLYVMNTHRKLQPVGIPGELYISGCQLARGYLNRDELTTERFVPNPFFPGEQMYKTGDLARWLVDGNIEYLGRLDNQVKIRGYRIETGEIEFVLNRHKKVKEAAVTVFENNGEKYLCGYVTSEETISTEDIKQYLAEFLPGYMIPAFIIHLNRMPLTPTGKLDRKALPRLDGTINTGTGYVAPTTEVEIHLTRLWEEVLGITKIGIHDNFFELGGDSIKAVMINAKLRENNYILKLLDFLKFPTISKISKYIKKEINEIMPDDVFIQTERFDHQTKNGNIHIENKETSILQTIPGETNALKINTEHKISTYLHRALPLYAVLADDKYYPWYYEHYINIFSYTDSHGLLTLDYMENEYPFQNIFYESFLGYDYVKYIPDLIHFIKDMINSSYYVIINIDEYYILETLRYKQEHFVHENMIYGYDDRQKQFMGIGFDKEWMLTKITYKYKELIRAFEKGKVHYKKMNPWAEKKAIQLFKAKTKELITPYKFSLKRFLMKLKCYLYSRGDYPVTYSLLVSQYKLEYGLKVYNDIIDRLDHLQNEQFSIDYRVFHLLFEHKKLILERLEYINSNYVFRERLSKLIEKYKDVLHQLNLIRVKFITFQSQILSDSNKMNKKRENDLSIMPVRKEKLLFDPGKNNHEIQEFKKLLIMIKNHESKILTDVYTLLSGIIKNSDDQ